MHKHTLGGICSLIISLPILSLPTAAQLPQYFVTPAVRPGGVIQLALVGQPGHTFATFVDLDGGPQTFLGHEFFLGLGPALTVLDAGTFGVGGLRLRSMQAPTTGVPAGMVFYLQALVFDARAPGGFRVSNGESTVLYGSTQVMVEEFSDPLLQGFTGTFDKSRRHRLAAQAISRRTHTVRPRRGMKFTQPIYGPLNPDGARIQMVYRNTDLGATGEREVLTAMRWLPFGKVTNTTFKRLVVEVGHTRVVPDFTIDPWTRLPRFPNSGLDTTFANNPKVGETPLRVIDSAYPIRTGNQHRDGYMDYPTPSKNFTYNGLDSLLLDFKMESTPGSRNTNGLLIQLMVLSSPRPNGRVHRSGKPGAIVNPHTVAQGRGDNSLSYMQFEFTRAESRATSPWRQAPVARPDYHAPYLAQSLPAGTRIRVEYRGASSATGGNATLFDDNINFADRWRFLQYRITLTANPTTGAVPSLEAIVIPID